jgi:hypothetical protein
MLLGNGSVKTLLLQRIHTQYAVRIVSKESRNFSLYLLFYYTFYRPLYLLFYYTFYRPLSPRTSCSIGIVSVSQVPSTIEVV